MDKKITRRVVLGAVIGGLAAGPFLLRQLRHGRSELLGDFELKWSHYVGNAIPAIVPVDVSGKPSKVSIGFNPHRLPRCKFYTTFGMYRDVYSDFDLLTEDAVPTNYKVLVGRVEGDSTNRQVEVAIDENSFYSRTKILSGGLGSGKFVLQGSELRVAGDDNGTHTGEPSSFAEVKDSIAYPVHSDSLEIGSVYNSPINVDYHRNIQCKLVGLYEIDGRVTARFEAKNIQGNYDGVMPSSDLPGTANDKEIEFFKSHKIKSSYCSDYYVCCQTGLIIHSHVKQVVSVLSPKGEEHKEGGVFLTRIKNA